MTSAHVLAGEAAADPDFTYMDALAAKTAARYWAGKEAYSLPKGPAIAAIQRAMKDKSRAREIFESLNEDQKKVLSIFNRYGGSLPGEVLQCEIRARGLAREVEVSYGTYRSKRWEEPVDLMRKRLLLTVAGRRRDTYGGLGNRLRYPDLAGHRGVLSLAESARPVAWKERRQGPDPKAVFQRRPAEPALDLARVARALGEMGEWTTNRGGALAKSAANRLRKAACLPCAEVALQPPHCESLYYELLRGLGAVEADELGGKIDLAAVEKHLALPALKRARLWVRAWIRAKLWQDGIGVVPDRDSDQDPVRIPPSELRAAREVLTWALCAVAHGPERWLDLETFLKDLHEAAGDDGIHFYWHGYSWTPWLEMAEKKEKFERGAQRSLAFWLEQEGAWAANAALSTLAHLGLVERGREGSGRKVRWCFRLTGLGKAVFGAPELRYEEPAGDAKFLKVLPNHEVLAYLDSAQPAGLWTLGRLAEGGASSGGAVETFRLTRESVYRALESGMAPAEIYDFLAKHAQTGLPENVAHSLTAWAGKREALVLRTGLALVAGGGALSGLGGRRIGERFVLAGGKAAKDARRAMPGCVVLDYSKSAPACWRTEEDGSLRVVNGADAVADARLRRFAQRVGGGWKITADSVTEAARRGLVPERIERWLLQHQAAPTPPILIAAVRNWSGCGQEAFVGELAVLHVAAPETSAAIRDSAKFREHLAGHIPPGWFVIKPGHREELERLLAATGFSRVDHYSLAGLFEGVGDSELPKTRRGGRTGRKPARLLVRIT